MSNAFFDYRCRMAHTTADEFLRVVLDPGSNISWDTPPDYGAISDEYAVTLARARERSGVDEAVITGEGTIGGRPVAYVVSEFRFLGGSIGAATARRIIDGIHQATARKLPLIISPSSGGTRMQEGTKAFALMISITTAVYRHKDAKLPFLVYLRNPTTGGVMASWGSSGHITFAEPNALLGFLGPRVVELVTGSPMPEGVQTGENLTRVGVIDGVVPVDELNRTVASLIDILTPTVTTVPTVTTDPTDPALTTDPTPTTDPTGLTGLTGLTDPVVYSSAELGGIDAWESILTTRDPSRPTLGDVLAQLPHDTIMLSGSGDGRRSDAVKVALTQIAGRPVMLIGQDRASTEPLGTNALRMARRGISLAKALDLPLVSIIDTTGAEMSQQAEEKGMSGSIARTLGELVDADVPTVSIILGQGCGGGALAMLPSDRVLCAQNAWLSPLPPEGASAILYRDVDHAAEMMEYHGVKSTDLLDDGIIDGIIPEYPDAKEEPQAFLARLQAAIEVTLRRLHQSPDRVGREQRFAHYERLAAQV